MFRLVLHRLVKRNLVLARIETQIVSVPNGLDDIGRSLATIRTDLPEKPNKDSAEDAVNKFIDYDAIKTLQFVKSLTTQLKCNAQQVHRILRYQPTLRDNRRGVEAVCQLLDDYGITSEAIIENPFLLGVPKKILNEKLQLLKVQSPHDLNDLVPLLRASIKRLTNWRTISHLETKIFPQGHRIYYLAERLKIEPKIVAKHVSTHLFMLDLPSKQFVENLNIQLKYNVASLSILRDPWAFRYSAKSIDNRLGRATDGFKDKLMPWMVRCPEIILAKSIQHSVDEKTVLGDKTLVEYVAERLGFDASSTKVIMDKHPAVHSVRVTKIKQILDYFLNESEFTANDVAHVPRILCHSLETTKTRLDQLRELGCKPSSLVIVCKSANEYRKFVERWTIQQEKNKSRIRNSSK